MIFPIAGALAVLAAIASYQAFDAFRGKDGKRLAIAVIALPRLVGAAGWLFSFGSRHATSDFWGNAGVAQDWECSMAPASARVCNRDLPRQLQDHPPPKD